MLGGILLAVDRRGGSGQVVSNEQLWPPAHRAPHAQAGDNPLEDTKYGCNITEELARQLAKSVQPSMQLSDYLLYI